MEYRVLNTNGEMLTVKESEIDLIEWGLYIREKDSISPSKIKLKSGKDISVRHDDEQNAMFFYNYVGPNWSTNIGWKHEAFRK